MNCPLCGNELRVVDSRPSGSSIRRRRDCDYCRFRTTTYEITMDEMIRFQKLEREKQDIMNTIRALIIKYDLQDSLND